jgi:hypothetical protein
MDSGGIKSGWMEKRQFERVAATVKVTYRIVTKEEVVTMLNHPHYKDSKADQLPELAEKSTVFHAVTRDVSLGGMAVVGDQPFPEGSAVAIHLHLPGYPNPVTLMAEIIRQTEIGGMRGVQYRAGVKILAINRADVVRMEKYLLVEKLKQENAKKRP